MNFFGRRIVNARAKWMPSFPDGKKLKVNKDGKNGE
jgi:hypothetical protein